MDTIYLARTRKKINYNHVFNQANAPSKSLKVSVVVPAQNEARNLRKTLDALRLQTDADGKVLNPEQYEVLLLANNCNDQTFAIAQNYKQKYPEFALHIAEIQLPPLKANIGFVRRLLMDAAYGRLTLSGNVNGIIASTDGDTFVDGCWVYHILQEIEKGCDAVGGRILTHSNQKKARLYHLRDVAYRSLLARAEAMIDPEEHDPWPRHFQYFGASMAVTCPVYEQVGRLPQVPFLEDNAFHQALQRMDVRIRKTPAVKAYTSTRMSGRVKVGFSEQLKKWSGYTRNGHTQEVEQAEAWIIKFKSKRALRKCWEANLKDGFYNIEILNQVAQDLFLKPNWLHNELNTNLYFGQVWENVRKKIGRGKWGKTWELVHITEAISALRQFVNADIKSFQTDLT
jgi:glycosyltransferase involved in cell wall biosynthesis